MNQKNSLIGLLMLAVGIAGYASGQSQKSPAESKVTTSPERLRVTGEFEFEVVECFDAKYLGDVPGYVGRHGELGDARPQASLGDPVYRNEEVVGHVSGLNWSRGHGSLEIEFEPGPNTRVNVGDVVHLKFGKL